MTGSNDPEPRIWRDDMANTQPAEFNVAGKPLKCVVCGAGHFLQAKALVNRWWFLFPEINVLSRRAVTATCMACGHIHWFARPKHLH